MIDRVVKFFCSLRLTVVLLGAGLVLVFVGTLAQVHEGLFLAQARYFKSWYIWKPTIGNGVWPILLPGGYLIGSMLLTNLIAAHIKRFQFTWKKFGIHLIHGGLILLLLGQLLTDVLSRESSMQLSEGSSSAYSEDFHANELAFIDSSDAASDVVVSIPEKKLAAGGEIRDAALPVTLRVLNYWLNCDVEPLPPASAVPIAANAGIFANYSVLPIATASESDDQVRAAVLVEIMPDKGPSLGTFFVPARTEDEQTFSYGGQEYAISCMFAPMMGGNLLAISRAGDMGGDSMATFPEADLKRLTELRHEGLPFKFQVKGYWPRCEIFRRASPGSVQPKITEGSLAGSFVTPQPPVTDTDHRNQPAVLVELLNNNGSLGTWLLWTAPTQPAEALTVGNKSYQMAFQFKRYYEPYSIGLLKFSHDQYKGTDIPSNFSSRIRLVNPKTSEDREVLIKMNTPLRYAGTTYYQAGFDQRRPDVTILEVVTNPSWLTPYLACVLVGLGLIIQFMSHLIGFAKKQRSA